MAKSKSFFGLRKGSTKTMTFSVLRGQQITKDRVTDIANPRTMDQTLQRIPFAQAVKFYKQATKGLFRFAYEDKRPLESDYNAFMRHNVSRALPVSRENYYNEIYPAMGSWLLSFGSLPSSSSYLSANTLSLSIATVSQAVSTVGGVSTAILARYPDLAVGDIVTFVLYLSSLQDDMTLDGNTVPSTKVVQFVINPDSEVTLASLGLTNITSGQAVLKWEGGEEDYACAGCVIFSRNTPNGLKVSTEPLKGNSVWSDVVVSLGSPVIADSYAYSWGASQKAILQGSLAE